MLAKSWNIKSDHNTGCALCPVHADGFKHQPPVTSSWNPPMTPLPALSTRPIATSEQQSVTVGWTMMDSGTEVHRVALGRKTAFTPLPSEPKSKPLRYRRKANRFKHFEPRATSCLKHGPVGLVRCLAKLWQNYWPWHPKPKCTPVVHQFYHLPGLGKVTSPPLHTRSPQAKMKHAEHHKPLAEAGLPTPLFC